MSNRAQCGIPRRTGAHGWRIGRSHGGENGFPRCPDCKAAETIVLGRWEGRTEFVCPNCAHHRIQNVSAPTLWKRTIRFAGSPIPSPEIPENWREPDFGSSAAGFADKTSTVRRLGGTLTPATQANAAELQQLTSFFRLLNQAATSKSEREIMRVFVEALAVWQDSESWAYFADVTGRYVLDVALPGSDRARVPSTLDSAQLPGDLSTPTRLGTDDLDTLGFNGRPDLLISRIQARGASDWLIVTDNPGDPDAEARLGVYVQAVVQALSEVNAIHASRLTWAMLEHLLPARESLASAAQGAVTALSSSVEAAAWFSVVTKDGVPVLTAGDLMSVLASPAPTRTPAVLSLPIDIAAPYRAAIGIRRSSAKRPLTGCEEQLLQLAASTLGTWLNAALDRLETDTDRRVGLRSFDQVLKRRIDDAALRGEQVSVILITLGPDLARTEIAHEWVARIRPQLRPSDMAGRLSSGEIGVVLPDTTSDAARLVVERLRRLLAPDEIPSGPSGVSIGLARLPENGD